MTIPEILKELLPKKRLSRPRLYFYLRRFNIKPLSRGIILRPQQYPTDTPQRILFKLGLVNGRLTLSPKFQPKPRK